MLEGKTALYVVDEFDVILDKQVVHTFGEFIKLLSDKGADLKVVLVGVSDSSRELLAGHPSVRRCLKEIFVEKLSDRNVADIVVRGAERAKIRFSNLATRIIVYMSDGFPYFTHLMALQCCEHAIAQGINSVEQPDVLRAVDVVSKDASATLSKEFNDATRSYKTEIYKDILLSAARYRFIEFSTVQIRNSVENSVGNKNNAAAIGRCLSKLVKDGVLHRVKRGHYKFRDPRMPAYIKIHYRDVDGAGVVVSMQ